LHAQSRSKRLNGCLEYFPFIKTLEQVLYVNGQGTDVDEKETTRMG